MAKEHRQGGKITNKHTSTIEPVASLVDYLKKKEDVNKIILGVITIPKTSRKSAITAIKILQEPAGLLLRITKRNAIQEIRVYTENKQAVSKLVENFAQDNGWETRQQY
jgi:hypothetical protein